MTELKGYKKASYRQTIDWMTDNPMKSLIAMVGDDDDRYHQWYDPKDTCVYVRRFGDNDKHLNTTIEVSAYYLPIPKDENNV